MKKFILIIFLISLSIFLSFFYRSIPNRSVPSGNAPTIRPIEDINPNFEDKKPQEKPISPKLRNILNSYPEFKKIFKSSNITIPIEGNMIPQGITHIEDLTLITAYDSRHIENSKCYIIDKDGNIKNTVTLDTKSHVGAIAFDPINDIIWIPGENGILNAYQKDDFLLLDKAKTRFTFDNISSEFQDFQNPNLKNIDFLTVHDNHIYIGNFSRKTPGLVKRYAILNETPDLNLEYENKFYVPPKTQGLAIYEHTIDSYLILSTSFGRNNPSSLIMYKFDKNIEDYNCAKKVDYKLPPMLEQITVDKDNLEIIFESPALKYDDCNEKVETACTIDLESMIKDYQNN